VEETDVENRRTWAATATALLLMLTACSSGGGGGTVADPVADHGDAHLSVMIQMQMINDFDHPLRPITCRILLDKKVLEESRGDGAAGCNDTVPAP
jgi:hypothetical protein